MSVFLLQNVRPLDLEQHLWRPHQQPACFPRAGMSSQVGRVNNAGNGSRNLTSNRSVKPVCLVSILLFLFQLWLSFQLPFTRSTSYLCPAFYPSLHAGSLDASCVHEGYFLLLDPLPFTVSPC